MWLGEVLCFADVVDGGVKCKHLRQLKFAEQHVFKEVCETKAAINL